MDGSKVLKSHTLWKTAENYSTAGQNQKNFTILEWLKK